MLKGLILMASGTEAWRRMLGEEGLPWVILKEKTQKGLLQASDELGVQKEEVLCLVETDAQERLAMECGFCCAGFLNPAHPQEQLSNCEILLEGLEEADRQFWEETYARAFGLPVQIARTPRLILREAALEDLPELHGLYEPGEREAFFPEWSENLPEEEARFRAYIRHMYGVYQFGMWVVQEKASGKLIGRAGFGIAEYLGFSEVDLGYFIGKNYRRKGYAEEACRAVLAYGKERLDMERVAAYVPGENAASLALIEKLGFVKVQEFSHEGQRLYRFQSLPGGVF